MDFCCFYFPLFCIHWLMDHYLSPLSIYHFDYTTKSGNIEDSPLYQNPYWPTVPNEVAIQ